jgi:hypothetical protein
VCVCVLTCKIAAKAPPRPPVFHVTLPSSNFEFAVGQLGLHFRFTNPPGSAPAPDQPIASFLKSYLFVPREQAYSNRYDVVFDRQELLSDGALLPLMKDTAESTVKTKGRKNQNSLDVSDDKNTGSKRARENTDNPREEQQEHNDRDDLIVSEKRMRGVDDDNQHAVEGGVRARGKFAVDSRFVPVMTKRVPKMKMEYEEAVKEHKNDVDVDVDVDVDGGVDDDDYGDDNDDDGVESGVPANSPAIKARSKTRISINMKKVADVLQAKPNEAIPLLLPPSCNPVPPIMIRMPVQPKVRK